MDFDGVNERIYSEFAYDDAFRTMEGECDDVLLPFVNHMFHENYDNSAIIRRLRNEHFVEHSDDSDEKRITDSHFEIVFRNVTKKYHLECESKKYDGSMLVRMFEYDSQIAIDSSNSTTEKLHIKFPNTGLLLLRKSNKNKTEAEIEIELPNGEQVAYMIPIINLSDYGINEIFENKMYMLIPFYIFNYESQLNDINMDDRKLKELIENYLSIFDKMRQEVNSGNLSPLSYNAIIKLSHRVVYKLTMKQGNVQKKVGDLMGGKVLDLPEFRIYHQGKDEGRAEGEKERLELKAEIDRLRKELEQIKKDKE